MKLTEERKAEILSNFNELLEALVWTAEKPVHQEVYKMPKFDEVGKEDAND